MLKFFPSFHRCFRRRIIAPSSSFASRLHSDIRLFRRMRATSELSKFKLPRTRFGNAVNKSMFSTRKALDASINSNSCQSPPSRPISCNSCSITGFVDIVVLAKEGSFIVYSAGCDLTLYIGQPLP